MVEVENEPQRMFLCGLWCNLIEWHQAGRQLVMYQELVTAEPAGIKALKQLLGEGFWKDLYGKRGDSIGPQDIVPNQLKYVLKETLNKIAAKVMGEEDQKLKLDTAAKENFAKILAAGGAKRWRAK